MTKNSKTRFCYVLHFDKTWVFDQLERAQGPIHSIKSDEALRSPQMAAFSVIVASWFSLKL